MQELRKFTDFLSELRMIETKRPLTHPKVALMGSPKSGKTSLLECLLGIQLFENGCEANVKYLEINTRTTDSQNDISLVLENTGEKYTDLEAFQGRLQEYTKRMRQEYDEILSITISSNFLPKWTLIELPSLAYIDPDTKDEAFLEQENIKRKIAKKIIKDESIIIVCVLSALESFEDSRVLEYAREFDPAGERTLGIITKYDILDNEDKKQEVRAILSGGKYPLKHGYNSINTAFARIMALNDSKAPEAEDSAPKQVKGSMETEVIIRRLKKIICFTMRTRFPSLFNEFQAKGKEYEEELEELGEDMDLDNEDTFKILWRLSNTLCNHLRDAISGSYMGTNKKKKVTLSCGAYIRSLFHYLYRKEDYQSLFETMSYTDEEIKAVMKNHNSVSLEGFITSESFKILVCDRLQHLEEPTFTTFQKICDSLLEASKSLLDKHFSRLPELKENLELFFEEMYKREKEKTTAILKPLLEAELYYIFCNDPEKVFQNVYALSRKTEDPSTSTADQIFDQMIHELKESCKLYCENVLLSLRDLVPKIIGQYFLNVIYSNVHIWLTNHINKAVAENPNLLKLTKGQIEERKVIENRLRVITKLKQYMIQDSSLYQFLRDPNLEENIFNKYQKRKDEYFKRIEDSSKRLYSQKKAKEPVKKKKENFFQKFKEWFSSKSKKKKPKYGLDPDAKNEQIITKDLRYPKEDFAPEEFAIKRMRANSLDMNAGSDEAKAQALITDFVLIEDYYTKDQEVHNLSLTKKEWMLCIDQGTFDNIEKERLSVSLQHGVPNELRASVWATLANIKKQKAGHPKLLYERLCKIPTKWDSIISKDVPRTYTREPFFKKPEYQAQERLHRILRAYANFDPELGYTQGMNSLAGLLLMVMSNYNQSEQKDYYQIPKSCEKNCFWIMVYIMNFKDFRQMFVDNCPRLMENLFKFEQLIKEEIPDVFAHMENEAIMVQGCFAGYFLTVCCQTCPVEFSKRIMDVFLLNGEPVIFDVLVKVMMTCKKEILALKGEKLFSFLKSDMMHTCFEKYKRELNRVIPKV